MSNPTPLTVSRDATPDYAPQFTLYAEDGGQGKRVATVFSKADAELFAAAPEMRDLLTQMRARMEENPAGPLEMSCDEIDKLDALLQRVGGAQ